jgi:hypothetical protein
MIKENSLEEKADYSTIGFSATTIVKELCKEEGYNPLVLNEAQEIVSHCKALFAEEYPLSLDNLPIYTSLLLGETKEFVNNPKINNFLKEKKEYIGKINEILERIIQNKAVSPEEIADERDFFVRVYENCRNHFLNSSIF